MPCAILSFLDWCYPLMTIFWGVRLSFSPVAATGYEKRAQPGCGGDGCARNEGVPWGLGGEAHPRGEGWDVRCVLTIGFRRSLSADAFRFGH